MVKTDTMPEGAVFQIGKDANEQWYTATIGGRDGLDFLAGLHSLISATREAFTENQPPDSVESVRQTCVHVQTAAYHQYIPLPELSILHLLLCHVVEVEALIEILASKRNIHATGEAPAESGGDAG